MPKPLRRSTTAALTATAPEPDEIRAARALAGLTQTEAGDRVYASLRTWQQWEAGDRGMHPGLFELFRIKTGQDKQKRSTGKGKN